MHPALLQLFPSCAQEGGGRRHGAPPPHLASPFSAMGLVPHQLSQCQGPGLEGARNFPRPLEDAELPPLAFFSPLSAKGRTQGLELAKHVLFH